MKFENEPTDEQLDELLKDIAVPHDLKSSLSRIPTEIDRIPTEIGEGPTTDSLETDSQSAIGLNTTPTEKETKHSKPWIAMILAASLIGFGLFIASQYLPSDNGTGPIAKGDPVAADPGKAGNPGKGTFEPENTSNGELVYLEFEQTELELIEAQIHAIEVAHLEAQLLRLEQASSFQLDQRETESMIAAMTEEYSIPLGISEEKVKTRMANVISKFPGTRGADIAKSYLEKQSKNN